MFGIGWIKGVVIGAVLLTIAGTIYAGYSYVSGLQSEVSRLTTSNATLTANIAQLTQAISEQQDTISSLQNDIESQARIFQETNSKFERSRQQVDKLRERLGKHELGYLAANKPGLVENIINNATDNIGRCFEIASGALLTEAERNATLPSQINRECPDLANPNYRGR